MDTGRADMLAGRGVTALALRWFGGPGLPQVPREVPLELFGQAAGLLAEDCDAICLIGLSYGAEAALLTASLVGGVSATVAIAPTDVAWEGHVDREEDPARSKWTSDGRPVPFVPLDRSWQPPAGKPAFIESYRRSRLRAAPEQLRLATIPVERFRGELVLIAGGDDQIWPSVEASARIVARRESAGLGTVLVTDDRAGHPVVLPGEVAPNPNRPYLVGGDAGAAERLGAKAWPAISKVLGLPADA
ncbi:alpha/beta fold hydrolase [Segeticoccus rhizosphaerae]|jgi:pimeloyl-ACP methyl ester carboxylesterase|nr:alpha/beta fold hydrolase [Ornithinicoccus soli]